MGLFDWLKRKDAGDASSTTFTVTTRDASVDVQDPEQREALEQAERLIHEFLTGGAGEASAGAGSAGGGHSGAFVFAAPTQVIVAGETVSADDPRALEAMSTAAAKLREHGLDELAAEFEARAGAGARPLSAPAADAADAADATPSAADVTPSAADVTPSAADAVDTLPSAPADDLGAAPEAPAPPEPPAPPS